MSLIGAGAATTSITQEFIDAALQGNQLLSGDAAWLSGLTFSVSPCTYTINSVLYSSAAEEVTLSAADDTHPRIDVIVVQSDGSVDVVEGTPAASPAKPEIDPDTQVEVTFVLIAAQATAPSNVSNTDVYLENTEWTAADSGATIDPDDTSDPYAGTKAILFDDAVNGNYLTLTNSTALDPSGIDRLVLYIKNIDYGTATNRRLRIALYNSTTRVSNWVNLSHGLYGFDGANTSTYQFVQIPFGNFIPNGTFFDRIRFQVGIASGGSPISCLLDNIKLQVGAPNTDTTDFAVLTRNNVWTAAQGSGITTLTDGATVSWDMASGNVYQLTLGGNRTIAAPTNVKPGYTYLLFLYQDGDGSRTVTWNAVFKWAGDTAPTLTTTASAVDVLSFVADASGNLHGTLGIAESS